MLLKKLTLNNFGQYRGRHEFDLLPKLKNAKSRPIILLGGNNGAGKTTLLEAVKLSLYGAGLIGNNVSKKDYHEYLNSRIHRNRVSILQVDNASVQLDFEFIDSSKKHNYSVYRTWERKNKSIHERLIIEKDNTALSELNPEHWQDFINDLVPQGLSSLFFFDGEKIQGLAEDMSSNAYLCESIKCLLGLDVIDRLRADLKIYRMRQIKKDDTNYKLDIKPIEDELEKSERLLDNLRQERAHTESCILNTQDAIANKEHDFRKMGGAFATQRDDLNKSKINLNAKLNHLQENLRDLCGGLLPFSLCPELVKSFKNQLEFELTANERQNAESYLRKNSSQLKAAIGRLGQQNNSSIDQNVQDSLFDSILTLLKESNDDCKAIHGLSQKESHLTLERIDGILNESDHKLNDLIDALEDTTRRLQQTESQIQKAPADDTITPTLKELSSLNQELGMWCKKADIQDDEIRKQEIKHGDLKRKFDKLTEKAASGHEFRKKIELIERSQQALEKYHDSLIESKISTLQSHFAESFAVLLRKENYISRISINRDDFSATLFDANNNPVPKEELSAGEKQIFAVAMLWALAKTSGRMLPVIIDTPLGRLDSEHRYHLIERYFPFASHQVIILSTDTEVDENYFQALAPWTARTFHLRYDQSDECTYVENKYFDFIDNKKELTGVAD